MERTDLLAQVASLYYEDGLTQAEIARQVDASRSTISRLLHEAREAGIVEITIHYPWKTDPKLENNLKERFQLRKALVLSARGRAYTEVLRGLGILAARHIDRALTQDSTLGISWGTAVYSTAQALRPKRRLPITVVQMIGAVGIGDPLIDGPDLARLMADIYRGEYRYLHAPLVVENGQVRQGLLQEPRIQETLGLARKVDIALVGIGSGQDLQNAGMLPIGLMSQTFRDILGLAWIEDAVDLRFHVSARHFELHDRTSRISRGQTPVELDRLILKSANLAES